jgi:hypothetical protein
VVPSNNCSWDRIQIQPALLNGYYFPTGLQDSKLDLESNKELVRRHLQLVSEGDAKGAAALWAPNSLNHGHQVDREALTKVFENLALLREHFTVIEIIAEGDW